MDLTPFDQHVQDVLVLAATLALKKNENVLWFQSQVLEDLGANPSSVQITEYIQNVIQKHKLGWQHSSFETFQRKQNEQDEYILNPFEAEEGVVECKRCKSFKVYSVSIQTRAADEPMTTVSICTLCKYKWSQNG